MKSCLVLVVLALVLAGCQHSTESPSASTGNGNLSGAAQPTASEQKPAPTPDTTAKMEAYAKGSGSGPTIKSGGAGEPSNSSSEPTVKDPREKVSRLYQLKDLKTAPIKAAGQSIQAWIMDTESKRQEGMMFLDDKDVKENQGMIFVFLDAQAATEAFWMHNCPMGLDIIYIDKNKKVLNVGDGAPENDDQVHPTGDYRWVLEMKRGWSARHGLKPGDVVTIPNLQAVD